LPADMPPLYAAQMPRMQLHDKMWRELISAAGSTRKIGKGDFIRLKQQKIRFPENIGVCGDRMVLRVTVISGEEERQQFAGKLLGTDMPW